MRFFKTAFFLIIFSTLSYANDGELVFSQEEISSFESQDINPDKSLSENLKNNKEESPTWLEELTKEKEPEPKKETFSLIKENKKPSELSSIVEERKITNTSSGKSNASVFDISGIMLRMSVLQAEEALKKRGYKKITQDMQIPNFIKWRNEEKCRNSGVVGYERLEACVNQLSKKENAQYIQKAIYKKIKTQEEVQIYMTSNFTGNKIYRILYTTQVPSIKGSSQKNQYLRNIKIYEFWRKINHKYGRPDDEEAITWSMGINKPFLKAQTGLLLLEDPMLLELDWTRMSREDQKYLNTDMYNF